MPFEWSRTVYPSDATLKAAGYPKVDNPACAGKVMDVPARPPSNDPAGVRDWRQQYVDPLRVIWSSCPELEACQGWVTSSVETLFVAAASDSVIGGFGPDELAKAASKIRRQRRAEKRAAKRAAA